MVVQVMAILDLIACASISVDIGNVVLKKTEVLIETIAQWELSETQVDYGLKGIKLKR